MTRNGKNGKNGKNGILYLRILIYLVIVVAVYELLQGAYRQHRRVRMYEQARARANELRKPLIVVGDPSHGRGSQFFTSLGMKNYGCGHETVDLTGAPSCPNGVKSDLYAYLREKPSNYGVFFISCVLEYVPNIAETVQELERVASDIYVLTVNPYCLAAYLYGDQYSSARQLVYAPPDYTGPIRWKTL